MTSSTLRHARETRAIRAETRYEYAVCARNSCNACRETRVEKASPISKQMIVYIRQVQLRISMGLRGISCLKVCILANIALYIIYDQ